MEFLFGFNASHPLTNKGPAALNRILRRDCLLRGKRNRCRLLARLSPLVRFRLLLRFGLLLPLNLRVSSLNRNFKQNPQSSTSKLLKSSPRLHMPIQHQTRGIMKILRENQIHKYRLPLEQQSGYSLLVHK